MWPWQDPSIGSWEVLWMQIVMKTGKIDKLTNIPKETRSIRHAGERRAPACHANGTWALVVRLRCLTQLWWSKLGKMAGSTGMERVENLECLEGSNLKVGRKVFSFRVGS